MSAVPTFSVRRGGSVTVSGVSDRKISDDDFKYEGVVAKESSVSPPLGAVAVGRGADDGADDGVDDGVGDVDDNNGDGFNNSDSYFGKHGLACIVKCDVVLGNAT